MPWYAVGVLIGALAPVAARSCEICLRFHDSGIGHAIEFCAQAVFSSELISLAEHSRFASCRSDTHSALGTSNFGDGPIK